MKKTGYIFCLFLLSFTLSAQTLTQKLQAAFSIFEKDNQLKNAISSLYVIDAQTGQVVFSKNSKVGLAPASTQKIITSVSAFELLGKDYRYKTEFGINNKNLSVLSVFPTGDPTFGSWRWPSTSIDSVMKNLADAFAKNKINQVDKVIVDNSGWDSESIPDGWIWQDIGNYYGAGARKFNFRENQVDIILQSGKSVGDSVRIVSLVPDVATLLKDRLVSKLTAAGRGTGDNAYVYLPSNGSDIYSIRGTIPVQENNFSISASIANPEKIFTNALFYGQQKDNSKYEGNGISTILSGIPLKQSEYSILYTHYSPSLDSIIYWFNKKSVNLYGESLLKTISFEKKGTGSTDDGVNLILDFWKSKNLDPDELTIFDGSGLSPQNRVTTHAQVEILKYAKSKDWFPSFLNALPEYNGMTMKSGTIRGVKGFTGYHKAKNGKEYIFSFLVNNYNGSPSALVNKMYRVLNNLK